MCLEWKNELQISVKLEFRITKIKNMLFTINRFTEKDS